MPTGTIVADNYIDDPNRTVSEMQTAMNQHLDYTRSLKTELAGLSSTTIREAAVRSVGTSANQIPDKEILDARLATTGNLGNMATKTASNYLAKSEFNPTSPTQVWSGSALSVPIGSLSESGPGVYIINSSGSNSTHGISLFANNENSLGTLDVINTGSSVWWQLLRFEAGSFFITRSIISPGSGTVNGDDTSGSSFITNIWKM